MVLRAFIVFVLTSYEVKYTTEENKTNRKTEKYSKDEQVNIYKSVQSLSVNINAIFLSKNDLKFLRQY